LYFFFFFFFQAEDGIRDYKVTGVQTCAFRSSARVNERLLERHGALKALGRHGAVAGRVDFVPDLRVAGAHFGSHRLEDARILGRSEERRVGKECRCRWGRGDEKNKKTESVKE